MSVIVDGSNGLVFNDASTQTTAATGFGFKNRIINGAMMVSQRGTSPTISGGGDYSVDRFYNYYSGDAYTSVQSSTAPAGFINSLLLTVTTASASPTYSFFGHKIEGLNCADLGFGTASASTITISFWVRSSVTGVYSLAVGNSNGDRAYAVQYTINSANTWEQKTMTIAGDTSGTWFTTNGAGIVVRWNMGTSSAGRLISAGSWQAANADGATGSTGANSWANTSGATFYITGVQLEKGSTATSFDFRDYGREELLCKRYFHRVTGSSGNGYEMIGSGVVTSGSGGDISCPVPVPMRALPTASFTGRIIGYDQGTALDLSSVIAVYGGRGNIYLAVGFASTGFTNGRGLLVYTVNASTGSFSFSAEL